MAQLVQQLNARLFERAPGRSIARPICWPTAVCSSWGSEGVGEQLLKTDKEQRPGAARRLLSRRPICRPFATAFPAGAATGLATLNTPGGIMLRNAVARHGDPALATARARLAAARGDSLMHLAIFMDAPRRRWRGQLLAEVRQRLMQLATDNDALVARFASGD